MKRGKRPPLYNRFYAIHARCNNPRQKTYERYGGRGIKCDWKSYDEFAADMLPSYFEHVAIHGEKNTTIDRIDSKGNYNKENCRWATREVQSNNRRNIILYTLNGKSQTLTAWSKELNISMHTLYTRLFKYKWTVEEALTGEKFVNQFI